MIKFGIKLGLAGGAVYFMAEQGVWKGSEEAVEVTNKISQNLAPYTNTIKKQIPYEVPSLPASNEVSYLAKHYWNRGVMATFGFLADLPSLTSHYACQGVKAVMNNKEIKELFNSQQPKPLEIKNDMSETK